MSVADVQSVAQRTVETSSCDLVEATCRRGIQQSLRYGQQIVARDGAWGRKPLCRSDLDLGADPADGVGDWCAGDRGQHADGRIAGQDADGSPTRRRTQAGPVDLAAGYHLGAVCAANRAAAATIAGS